MDAWPPVDEAVALYAQGWFPMDDEDRAAEPLPFYAAQERAVFDLSPGARAALRRRLRRSLRAHAGCALVRDRHFEKVLAACAAPRAGDDDDGVWITPRMVGLYRRLHAAGVAHTYELERDGELAAGVLAVRIRRAAMLESMAHSVPGAGNALLSRLLDALAEDEGAVLCDIQLPTEHTLRLGAQLIGREDYEERLRAALS
ncbi:MAG: leucyl/phenylalanyl-tRNA--protein transferase [Solirubrobacteraceae bacterium]